MEVEFCSRNFVAHGHDSKKCDVIVCWVHNWPECPEWIEVVELRKVVEKMRNRGDWVIGGSETLTAEARRRGGGVNVLRIGAPPLLRAGPVHARCWREWVSAGLRREELVSVPDLSRP